MTVLQILQDALQEFGAYGLSETLSAADSQFAFRKLNRMLDAWDANRDNIFSTDFLELTLIINKQPLTIGQANAGDPQPDYPTATQRPTRILNANIILNNTSPATKSYLNVHNFVPGADWWAANSVPTVTTQLSTDLYYNPGWPWGQLYLWPVPTVAYGLELEVWTNISAVSKLTDIIWLPQGYWDAIVLSLAEACCTPFGFPQALAVLGPQAAKARANIKSLNAHSLAIVTKDAGIPGGGGRDGSSFFNWLNGSVTGPRG